MVGCSDQKLNRSFIRGMVYTGQPMVGAVGPIVAKKSAVAKFVGVNDEAIGGDACVLHHNIEFLSSLAGLR